MQRSTSDVFQHKDLRTQMPEALEGLGICQIREKLACDELYATESTIEYTVKSPRWNYVGLNVHMKERTKTKTMMTITMKTDK